MMFCLLRPKAQQRVLCKMVNIQSVFISGGGGIGANASRKREDERPITPPAALKNEKNAGRGEQQTSDRHRTTETERTSLQIFAPAAAPRATPRRHTHVEGLADAYFDGLSDRRFEGLTASPDIQLSPLPHTLPRLPPPAPCPTADERIPTPLPLPIAIGDGALA